MNDAHNPPLISTNSAMLPPTDDPDSHAPIPHLLGAFEAILREQSRVIYRLSQSDAGSLIVRLLALALVLDLGYGVVVGTFSGGTQLWIAPVKIATGLFLSAIICLPSLYILACLGGARVTMVQVAGLVAGLLALMNILLIGFAPVAWVFSQSTESAVTMGALHLFFALVSIYFGLRFVQLGFDKLGGGAPSVLKVWVIIFLLVLMQMTTALRPIVGTADTLLPAEKKFFTSYWGDCLGWNAPSANHPK